MVEAIGLRWRKAMIVSLIFHSIILVGVGWLTVRALLPVEAPETIIELELAGEPEGAPLPAAAPEAAPVTASQPVTAPVRTPVVQQRVMQPVVPEVVETEAVVAVSSLNVVSVDSAAVSSSLAATGGGTGAAGSGSGSGGSGGGSDGGAGGGQAASQGTIPPSLLSPKKPPYPESARRDRQEGTVVLRIEIMENGRARQVSVQTSSGHELLDRTAVDSAQNWRFVPAKIRATGKAVSCFITLPVNFNLVK